MWEAQVTLTNCLACTREITLESITRRRQRVVAEPEPNPGSKLRIVDSRDDLEEGSRNCNEFIHFSWLIIDPLKIDLQRCFESRFAE